MAFKWVDGFKPGLHCTEIIHHVRNELAELPPRGQRHPRAPYVCADCLQRVLKGIAQSDAAKRGVETRRQRGGKRAPRRAQ
jgi:hypothetical protein